MTSPPASWLTMHADALPARGDALDVACGSGRHAIWLAKRGLRVHAVDRDADAIERLRQESRERGLAIRGEVVDLEDGAPALTPHGYDVIVVVHYLHRPLMPVLIDALRPDGLLIYETFTRAQALRGKPTNPAFLLEAGELERMVRELKIIDSREGDYDGRSVASVVARRA